MSDIHALIHDFLQGGTVVSLSAESYALDEGRYLKAGIVPFVRGEPWRFYLMKPQAKIASLSAPRFQLCKGTRMHKAPGAGWRDMKETGERYAQQETLLATALREGIEELGLKLDNIDALYDAGPYEFSSATTGKGKEMWLFAASLHRPDDFLPQEKIAASTQARAWFSNAEFDIEGREDHRYILRDIEAKLGAAYPTV